MKTKKWIEQGSKEVWNKKIRQELVTFLKRNDSLYKYHALLYKKECVFSYVKQYNNYVEKNGGHVCVYIRNIIDFGNSFKYFCFKPKYNICIYFQNIIFLCK